MTEVRFSVIALRRSCRARVSQTLRGFLNGDGGQVLLSVEGYG